VDCLEYISEYLAAHADNELSLVEQHAAETHLSGCAQCRGRLISERVLKRAILQQAGIAKAPAELRLRIRAALNDPAGVPATTPSNGGWRRLGRRSCDIPRRAPVEPAADRRQRRKRVWIPIGITSSVFVLLALLSGQVIRQSGAMDNRAVPAFDIAISKYLQFGREFHPNVPPEAYDSSNGVLYAWVMDRNSVQQVAEDDPESDDISRSYREADMPGDLFDFSAAGYHITGGRVDHLPDGRRVTYTMYQSDAGQILSLCFSDSEMAAPIGAVEWVGMRSFYAYKGYSICLTFYPTGHFISILVTRMPVYQLLSEVASNDVVAMNR